MVDKAAECETESAVDAEADVDGEAENDEERGEEEESTRDCWEGEMKEVVREEDDDDADGTCEVDKSDCMGADDKHGKA